MKTISALREIELHIADNSLPKALSAWGGADVVISFRPQQTSSESFYPEPRFVVTPHALEVSWILEELLKAFNAEERLDGQTKIEFFGRLANAANRCLKMNVAASAHELCAAILHESFAIYEEMERGTFDTLGVALGNEIVDDYVDDVLESGFIGIEETRKFFSERRVNLENA